MRPSPFEIGIVGAGSITRNSHLPVLLSSPNVKVVWIYDRQPANARALAAAYGVEAARATDADQLPACEVALLAIPVDARGEYLHSLRARGVAVLCEKPFALSMAEHLALVEYFPLHALGAGFMRRYYRSALLLRRIVRDGIFGPLKKIEIAEGNRSRGSGADSSFLDDPRLSASRGVLTDLGSHSIDLALYVSAATSFEVACCTKILDGAVDRKINAKVRLQGASFDGPVEMDYGVSWLDRQENLIRLTFAHATVWSGLGPAAEVYAGNPNSPGDAIRLSAGEAGASTYNQAFYLEWQDFLEGLSERKESLISARTALLTTSLVEALLQADDSTGG